MLDPMRLALLLSCLAAPALAWDFTPGQPCRLSHDTAEARIELTYDPTQPLYTITIERSAPWPVAPVFSMRFDGPHQIGIGTDRHRLSADGTSLTVFDTGFGNVLDGLQFNHTAWAISGDVELPIPLEGAPVPVAAFRACANEALAS